MTSANDRAVLLRIARDAIVHHVGGVFGAPRSSSLEPQAAAVVGRCASVFVTVHVRGALRGCIGRLEADEPLPRSVAWCAVAACSEDARFPPVAPSELHELHIEVSVLGPMEPAAGPGDVVVGRHGLMVEMGSRRGLLLPQVAEQWRWDAEAFLSQTCRKAGLPVDSWRRGATIWRFEAEVFEESAGPDGGGREP